MKLGLLGQYDIKTWPLGGDIMDKIDLTVLLQNYSVIALVDNDPGSKSIRERFIKNCKDLNIPVCRLERYAIENYFSLEALRKVFGTQIDSSIKSISPDQSLEKQIGINVKKNNRKIAEKMALEEIKDTDLWQFFQQVESICKSNKNL